MLQRERGELRQVPVFDRFLAVKSSFIEVASTPKSTLTCKFLIMTDQVYNNMNHILRTPRKTDIRP